MNILWLAPVAYFNDKSKAHPAPWISTLASSLVENNVNLTILNYSHFCTEGIEKQNVDGINYIFLKSFHPKLDILSMFYFRISRLKQFIRQNEGQFDVIHVHGNEHQYELALSKSTKPIVLSIQGIVSECLKYYRPKGFQRISWEMTSLFESKGYKTIKNYSCRTDWDKGIILGKNVNANIFHIWEMIRKPFFEYDHQTTGSDIFFLGGSQKLKGIDIVLKAFSLFKKKVTDSKLIIGGNINKDHILKYIKDSNLSIDIEKDIVLFGFMNADQIIANYRTCFCMLHPSLIDNSPNSVCEAQATGLPVLATRVGGVASLIQHKKTGVFIDFDPIKIADSLFEMHSSDKLSSMISKDSRKMARKRHDPEIILKETLQMYNTIISQG